MARAENRALSEQKVQAFFHYLDSVKGKFKHLAVRMMNRLSKFSKLNPALASMVIYVFCMGTGLMMLIVIGFLDLAAGTHVLEALLTVLEKLNEHVLPALQLLNGLLALLFGFSILLGRLIVNNNNTVNPRRSRPNPNKMSTLSRRSMMIRSLPKAKYGCLRRRSDDDHVVNKNDSSSSSCCICLGCIGEEDRVRILPNCRHYFHIACIDRWLLQCTATDSSCPLCRATVISSGIQLLQTQ